MKPRNFFSSIWLLLFAVALAGAAPVPNQAQACRACKLSIGPYPLSKMSVMQWSGPPEGVHVDGQVQAGKLVHRVLPVYPAAAKKADIQGTVILKALISEDGRVESLQYVSGPRSLTNSAMDAVRQWQYAPTLLNGKPVKVEALIKVVYTLGKPKQKKPKSHETFV